MGEEDKSPSWWKTVPGILTGVAAFLTAVTGLIVALNQIGLLRGVKEPTKATIQAPAPRVAAKPAEPSFPVVLPQQQESQAAAMDHPLVSRFPGSELLERKVAEFDEFLFPLGPIISADSFEKEQRLEGKVTKFKYSIPENRSSLEIIRSYQDSLQRGGFEILYKCNGLECFSGLFQGGYTNSASGTWCRNCDEPMRYLAAKLLGDSGNVYVALVVVKDRYEGGTWLSIIEVKP